MISKPQRYLVSGGLLLLMVGVGLRALLPAHAVSDFVVGLLVGAGLALELVGVWQARRRS